MGTITVTNLGKAYKQYPTHWGRLAEWLIPGHKPRHTLKWVLQDINFTVYPGEAVGIIGVNGAGKSTLLKMITGTTQPTTGSVQTTGRVAALLELGMGFHPDFTGRQNVLMAGQLLGYTADEIATIMPEIEAFADIGEYINQPVRIYSSGMQARLAFSVATSIKPDILIIDEALSVGDLAFQAKCMQRMIGLQKFGVTILFVSHALNQVRQFCSKALYVSGGHLRAFGPSDSVCDLYQNELVNGGDLPKKARLALEKEKDRDGGGQFPITIDENLRKNSVNGGAGGTLDLEFIWFKIYDDADNCINACKHGQPIKFRACIRANKSVPNGSAVGLLIADKTGYHLFACNTNYYDVFLPELNEGQHILVEWSFRMPLAAGELRIDSGIKPEPFSSVFYDRVFCVQTLTVTPDVELLKRNFGGYLFVDANVSTRRLD